MAVELWLLQRIGLPLGVALFALLKNGTPLLQPFDDRRPERRRSNRTGLPPEVANRSAIDSLSFANLPLSALLLLLLGLLVFRDFVFGDKVLLYKEVGSDSLNDYFPTFAHLSDYLRTSGLPSWSFSVGMGQNLIYLIGYLVLDPVVWLPKIDHSPMLSCFSIWQRASSLVAIFEISSTAWPDLSSLAGGFSAALFFGFHVHWSCWIVFADEIVCFTFVLFAVEDGNSGGRWVLFATRSRLVSLITVFHLYLCAVLLSFYLPASADRTIWLETGRAIIASCAQLAAVCFPWRLVWRA